MTILDTNVISELMRSVPDEVVRAWSDSQPNEDLYVTAISVAEIFFGIELLPAGKRRDTLHVGAEKMFGMVFADHILPFDERGARVFSHIASSRRRQGRPILEFDAQIAAIARTHGATVATRDTSDFEGCGVRLVNPWEG